MLKLDSQLEISPIPHPPTSKPDMSQPLMHAVLSFPLTS